MSCPGERCGCVRDGAAEAGQTPEVALGLFTESTTEEDTDSQMEVFDPPKCRKTST